MHYIYMVRLVQMVNVCLTTMEIKHPLPYLINPVQLKHLIQKKALLVQLNLWFRIQRRTQLRLQVRIKRPILVETQQRL